MQRGTKQTEEARKAISKRMQAHWAKIPYSKRSVMAKKSAKKRQLNKQA